MGFGYLSKLGFFNWADISQDKAKLIESYSVCIKLQNKCSNIILIKDTTVVDAITPVVDTPPQKMEGEGVPVGTNVQVTDEKKAEATDKQYDSIKVEEDLSDDREHNK